MVRMIICFLPLACMFIGCSDNSGESKNPYENKLGIEPTVMAQMDTANYTEITWLDTLINIGSIRTTDTAKISFRFKNTGNKPLFVISVQPACGCTVADYSKEPVWVGKEGIINGVFKWNGQTGAIRKTIGVRTNTSNGAWHTLSFYGEVIADSAKKQ